MSKNCKKCGINKLLNQYNKRRASCKQCCEIKCPQCDKIIDRDRLSRHISAVHEQKKAWTCEKCNKSFKQKEYKNRHACLNADGNVIPERQAELIIQKRMELETGGRQTHCMFGIIDLTTTTEIIEIKNWFYWKHALGQIIAYSHCYPDLTPRLHFFGNIPENSELIIELIEGQGITVSYE
jgi:hypothetical protein